jgi:lipoprotein-anchoring transpeptidase ErfK/SrfK
MSPLQYPQIIQNSLTRREFLLMSGTGLAGLFISPHLRLQESQPEQQGRVLEGVVSIYSKPSFNSEKVREYWKDMVLPISEVTIGDDEPAFNRVWYRISDEGYVHSGVIQPVQTVLDQPATDIPPEGALAEVTVPYTDAHVGPAKSFSFGYRYYYATTHWVLALIYNADGEPWYHVMEDKWDQQFYVPATHLRIVPSDELTPISPEVPPAGKRIEVRTQDQTVIAYEFDRPVFMTRAATGGQFSNGNFATPAGRHITFHKRPSRHMAAGNLAYNGYDLPGVPWIVYFTESGISFHGTYWHNNYGHPRSHGCVNLTPSAAKWLYRWTVPVVPPNSQDVYEDYGTAVDVID